MSSILETLMRERGICRLSGAQANKLTRECLQKALILLMGERPFKEITITEIVKRSGVSRQSFYRNYKSKEEILFDVSREIETGLQQSMLDEKYREDSRHWYEDLFLFVKKHQDNIRLFSQARIDKVSDDHAGIFPAFKNIFPTKTKAEEYRLAAYESGISAICRKWFLDGMTQDSKEMADLCESLYGTFHRELLGRIEKTQ